MYILAVDDERLALEALKNELGELFPKGNILALQKPVSALEEVRRLADEGEKLQYAFLDIEMQGISGLELAREIKKIFPDAMLFFCTAYSEYAYDAYGLYAKGYLLKPILAKDIKRVLDEMVVDWQAAAMEQEELVKMQTFGHFEAFVDGKPLKFEREKAKELLAYLVDRHGASVTTEQIALTLWEDEAYDRKVKNRVTSVVSSLRATLKAVGAEEILIKTWNHLAIDTSKIKCDAYDYEKRDVVAVNSFRGEYMSNYSWAEFTTGKYAQMAHK